MKDRDSLAGNTVRREPQLRHLGAILLLPVTVTVVVPGLVGASPRESGWDLSPLAHFARLPAGALLLGLGLYLLARAVWLFARFG